MVVVLYRRYFSFVVFAYSRFGRRRQPYRPIGASSGAVFIAGGTLEKTFRTEQLLFSCTAFRYKRLVSLTVNLFFTLTVSAGCIVRFFAAGNISGALSWLTGCFFISALAFALASLTKKRRLFEALFFPLFYMGPVKGIPPYLDFLGLHGNYAAAYLTAAFILTAAGFPAKR